jgi:endogenous inhibitor of DNA gyrase (YacG/DUF329 family)
MNIDFANKPRELKTCQDCGKRLTRTQRAQRNPFCSSGCAVRHLVIQNVCRYCGDSFKPKANARTIFCSRTCASAYHRVGEG